MYSFLVIEIANLRRLIGVVIIILLWQITVESKMSVTDTIIYCPLLLAILLIDVPYF